MTVNIQTSLLIWHRLWWIHHTQLVTTTTTTILQRSPLLREFSISTSAVINVFCLFRKTPFFDSYVFVCLLAFFMFWYLSADPKVFLDEAWILLEPALTSILHEENLDRFCFGEISQAVDKTSCNTSSSEDLSNLIVDVCGTYISTTLHSLAVHCNDDDSSLLLLPLEKFWLEFPKKLRFICEIAGAGGPNLWELGLNLLPRKLFLASQICDKVRTFILLRVTDQR